MKYITKIEAMTKEEFQEAGGKAAHLQGELKQPFAEVKGEQEIITRVKECRASLWTARAAFLRRQQGIEHSRGLIAQVVQKMVNSDGLVSGDAIVDYFVIDKERGTGRKKYTLTGNMITDCIPTDDQLKQLASLGPKIEAVFGYPGILNGRMKMESSLSCKVGRSRG